MKHKEFFEEQVRHGRSDFIISFFAEVLDKEISEQEFIKRFRKVPTKTGTRMHKKRDKYHAIKQYNWLLENGLIKKPSIL